MKLKKSIVTIGSLGSPLMTKENQLCVYDVTLKASAVDVSVVGIKKWLKTCAKRWVFQLELGKKSEKHPDGYLHYQIRLSLRLKLRQKPMLKVCNEKWGKGFGKLSPTSAENATIMELSGEAFYCMKEETRQDGPWSDRDPAEKYIQKRFRNPKLRDWQSLLYQQLILNKTNDRNIILVCDSVGNHGKSFFAGYMLSHQDTIRVPATCENAKQMMEYLASHPKAVDGWAGTILIDVPRSTSAKHWYTLCGGLEVIKQGFWYDGRNRCREVVVEPPAMAVFCNNMPGEATMSKDVFQLFEHPDLQGEERQAPPALD